MKKNLTSPNNMVIETWEIERAVNALTKNNPGIITAKQLSDLRNGIKQFGLLLPPIFNKRTGNIVGGHQRIRAAQAEGLTEIEVNVVDFEEKAEARLGLALNRINGKWDYQILEEVLAELSTSEAIAFSGFSESDLVEIMSDYEEPFEESFESFAERFSTKRTTEFVAFRSAKVFFTCSKQGYEALIQRLYAEVGVDDIAAGARFFKLIGLG
ncbi:ParB N-terminal domain-containing protein [Nostoc linckia]|uniref:ParB N-terminal domain-containing protein n=1 Tax=Nostoc linckia TaxID=92942 RepID=UPI000BFFF8A2|nr:ParB N-terminal domain-containing protein [Nostoc linckia]